MQLGLNLGSKSLDDAMMRFLFIVEVRHVVGDYSPAFERQLGR